MKNFSILIFNIGLALWYGAVIFINLVLIPSLNKFDNLEKIKILQNIFRRTFIYATFLVIPIAFNGLIINWGIELNIQKIFGFGFIYVLIIFHLIITYQILPQLKKINDNEKLLKKIIKFIKIAPRIGLVIISLAILLIY